MRLYPAGGVASFRRIHTGKDLVLGGGKLVVPAGVALHFPITAVHHSRAVWEDPEAFSPERFLEVRPAPCARGAVRCSGSAACLLDASPGCCLSLPACQGKAYT